MTFLTRIIVGFLLFAAGLGAAGYGVFTLLQSFETAEDGRSGRSGASERTYTVAAGRIAPETISPEITTYGEIHGWRVLEIRTKAGGYVVDLADTFRDGAEMAAGEVMFRIDPEEYAAAEADARAAVAEARADLEEARQTIGVMEREMNAADTQRDLRASALERQKDLLTRGVTTSTVVEDAQMALAAAEQISAGRAQSLLAARIRIDRSELKLRRAEIALSEARRDLAQTEHRAPFRGLVSGAAIALGALAAPNEKMGALIDPTALEAVFRVSNAQFARLLNDRRELKQVRVAVTLELDETPLTVTGVIDRAGAEIGAGATGRLVYARLELEGATLLRPGDFVTVTITEPPLKNVTRVPAAAVTEAGGILLIGDDDRLTEAKVRLMRRVGNDVLIADAPPGARFVEDRGPQLGPGVKVKVIDADGEEAGDGPAMVDLAPDQQRRLIEFVEASKRMPKPVKKRILATLRSGRAPQSMVERITQRMGDRG